MQITPRQVHDETSYRLQYTIKGTGSGYGFDCDEQGNVDVADLNPAALKNWEFCQAGQNDRGETIICDGVEKFSHRWIEPAVGICDCGEEVDLDGFTNTCENCGADYNSSGQKLAPREQWGEETGEHLSDILGIP
jgi:hypothetical protein